MSTLHVKPSWLNWFEFSLSEKSRQCSHDKKIKVVQNTDVLELGSVHFTPHLYHPNDHLQLFRRLLPVYQHSLHTAQSGGGMIDSFLEL